jgi:hypothetical protein
VIDRTQENDNLPGETDIDYTVGPKREGKGAEPAQLMPDSDRSEETQTWSQVELEA